MKLFMKISIFFAIFAILAIVVEAQTRGKAVSTYKKKIDFLKIKKINKMTRHLMTYKIILGSNIIRKSSTAIRFKQQETINEIQWT